ncbi:Cytochrome c oxidase subunit 7A [Blastocladiella emersonii ATCC 22665]|nr:Cytochrome c oxidase subunit 7A [Blastocladiella emersonii ATCC 22665]
MSQIAPITGMLRRKFFVDLTIALGSGTAAGYWWWNNHTAGVQAREAKLREIRIASGLPVSQ